MYRMDISIKSNPGKNPVLFQKTSWSLALTVLAKYSLNNKVIIRIIDGVNLLKTRQQILALHVVTKVLYLIFRVIQVVLCHL